VLTTVAFVSEEIATFLQLILFANTTAFFCSLLGLVSHSFEKATAAMRKLTRDGVASKRSITYAILGLFYEMMGYKLAFHAYSAIVDSFFCAYSAFVDSFVLGYFFS